MEISLGMSCDINELLRQCGLDSLIGGRTAISSKEVDGGRFVSVMGNGKVMAAYYHPTRAHSATAVGGNLAPTSKSTASAGKWAVAIASRGLGGTKTFYNFV